MVATILSGKDLAAEVRGDLKRKVRGKNQTIGISRSEYLKMLDKIIVIIKLCRLRKSRTTIPTSSLAW